MWGFCGARKTGEPGEKSNLVPRDFSRERGCEKTLGARKNQ